jgi:MFS family permease
VGLIIGVFAFAAMVLRPVASRLADRVGRRPLVLAGALVFAVASASYPAVDGTPALLALRVFHGIGMGLGPTAATVMVTDLAPVAHRGAALGVYALANSCGLAVGPFVGIELTRRLGFPMTFSVSGGSPRRPRRPPAGGGAGAGHRRPGSGAAGRGGDAVGGPGRRAPLWCRVRSGAPGLDGRDGRSCPRRRARSGHGHSSGSVLMGVAAARLGYPAMWALAAGVVGLGVVGATPHITRPRG